MTGILILSSAFAAFCQDSITCYKFDISMQLYCCFQCLISWPSLWSSNSR